MTGKKWGIGFLVTVLTLLILLGGFVVVIDPFFHYHAPILGLQYPLNNQRYQNDGIVKHFEYDAIITGTSMTENFKASEFDELFGCKTVKVSLSGGSYREVNEQLACAAQSNPSLKYICRSIDGSYLYSDKDIIRDNLPTYLYNNILWDDVQYVFNKDVLFKQCSSVLHHTFSEQKTTSFDTYSNWMRHYAFGQKTVNNTYNRPAAVGNQPFLTEEEQKRLYDNIQQNFIDLAQKYPEIQFYVFFPPYSIYYWDEINQTGKINSWPQAQELATQLLLEQENIHVFSFFDEYDMICDLDNYKDSTHYGEWVNSQILHWMKSGEHQLTKDNYQDYYRRIRSFYSTYDYDSLFEIPEN